MKRKWLLLAVLIVTGLGLLYSVLVAPSKLSQVQFVVVEKGGAWKSDISRYVLSYVHLGQDLTPEFLADLRKKIESLPWVRRCSIDVKGGKLIVKIWEVHPKFVLIFNRESYLVGENDFVLKKGVEKIESYPVYFYRGKSSPFTVENGFLRLKKSVKMKLSLLALELRELNLKGKKPQISLLDSGVQLAFESPPLLVFLGIGGDAWNRFDRFFKGGFLKPGVYDFRFEQMLVIKGRQENVCSENTYNRSRNKLH